MMFCATHRHPAGVVTERRWQRLWRARWWIRCACGEVEIGPYAVEDDARIDLVILKHPPR